MRFVGSFASVLFVCPLLSAKSESVQHILLRIYVCVCDRIIFGILFAIFLHIPISSSSTDRRNQTAYKNFIAACFRNKITSRVMECQKIKMSLEENMRERFSQVKDRLPESEEQERKAVCMLLMEIGKERFSKIRTLSVLEEATHAWFLRLETMKNWH